MSNKRAKEERSKAKDIRQMPIDENIHQKRNSRKKKSVVVEYKVIRPLFVADRGWEKWGKYTSEEIAENVAAGINRKHSSHFEARIRR